MRRALELGVDFLLHRILRHQRLPGRGMALIRLRSGAADLAPGDALNKHKHVGAILQAAVADALFDSPLPEDLHRADPAAARLWMVGRGRAFLHHHAIHAEAMQQQRHGQAHRATTHDEDSGVLLVSHGAVPRQGRWRSRSGSGVRRPPGGHSE